MLRRLLDTLLARIAHLALLGFYRGVEHSGGGAIPRQRPVLVVANHPNGFVDAVVVADALGRLPRFLAKATLWRILAARPFLALAGLVPVQRRQDSPGSVDNTAAFSTADDLLRRGGLVAIFPEGTTHRRIALQQVRTGAARIALGARAAGAAGLVVVPLGITFEDRVALRSRVLARFGEPIDLDAAIDRYAGGGSEGPDNPDAVRRLTADIEQRLGAVTPSIPDDRLAAEMSRAAMIALRTPRTGATTDVPLAVQVPLTQRLADAPADRREEVRGRLGRYVVGLDLVRMRDEQAVAASRPDRLLREAALATLRFGALATPGVAGTAVNAVPYAVVTAAGRRVREPLLKGTVRLLAALVVFPATWSGAAYVTRRRGASVGAAVAVFLAGAPSGIAAVHAFEQWTNVRTSWRGWQAVRDYAVPLEEILADREALVEAVREATA